MLAFLQHSREIKQVLGRFTMRVAAETGNAVLYIGRITDLAHLAVADYVHAELGLAPHDFINGIRNDLIGSRLILDRALFPTEDDISHCLGARQTADMRG